MHRFFVVVFVLFVFYQLPTKGEETPVRLHVIAQSDDEKDQEIKMAVKDAVFEKCLEITRGAHNASDAYGRLFTAIGEIRSCARDTAAKCGFTGQIEALVTREHFPARLYGDLIMKEGEYPVLLIRIGEAAGKNWWCVIYPDLCLYGEKTDTGKIEFYSKFRYWLKRWTDRWSA